MQPQTFLKPQSGATAGVTSDTVDRCTYPYSKSCLQAPLVDALGFWGREMDEI